MNKLEFDEMLVDVLDNEIEITMIKDKSTGIVWYDMNTGMKSPLWISYDGEKCLFRGRYDNTGEIKNFEDLLVEINNCKYGRDFGNQKWLEVISDYSIILIKFE
ncbi:hypothetical protein GW796_07470 [archaeon]|nr:hypothetical protein [archaeon]NCQ51722.1 hypothetical protein [archaeon]